VRSRQGLETAHYAQLDRNATIASPIVYAVFDGSGRAIEKKDEPFAGVLRNANSDPDDVLLAQELALRLGPRH
jgi:hypothetical protein